MRDDETIILNHLRRACEIGAESPTNSDMMADLRDYGILRSHQEIAAAIKSLVAAGRLEIYATRHNNKRWFKIPGTDLATVRRSKAREMERRENPPAPKPPVEVQPKPFSAYDAAVARREFGRPEHQTRETPGPFVRIRAPYGWHSLVGCAAEMVAV